jgi:hypothetical protein
MFLTKTFRITLISLFVAGTLIWLMLFFHLEKNKYISRFILFLHEIPVDLKFIIIFVILFGLYIIFYNFSSKE